jgi:hypothetical protein
MTIFHLADWSGISIIFAMILLGVMKGLQNLGVFMKRQGM